MFLFGEGDVAVHTCPGGFEVNGMDGRSLAKTKFRPTDHFLLTTVGPDAEVVLGDLSDDDKGLYVWDWKRSKGFVHVPLGRQIIEFFGPKTPESLLYQTLEFNPKKGLSTEVRRFDLKSSVSQKIDKLETGAQLLSFRYFVPHGMQIGVLHNPAKRYSVMVDEPGKGAREFFSGPVGEWYAFRVDGQGKTMAALGGDGFVRVWKLP
jgi:hypothetical protein